MNILVSQDTDALKVYVIREESTEDEKDEIGSFLDSVIRIHYSSIDQGRIMIEEELVDSPSQ